MIGRRRDDGDGIDLAIVEEAAKVGEGLWLGSSSLFDFRNGPLDVARVDIADGANADVGMGQELPQAARPHAAHANHA